MSDLSAALNTSPLKLAERNSPRGSPSSLAAKGRSKLSGQSPRGSPLMPRNEPADAPPPSAEKEVLLEPPDEMSASAPAPEKQRKPAPASQRPPPPGPKEVDPALKTVTPVRRKLASLGRTMKMSPEEIGDEKFLDMVGKGMMAECLAMVDEQRQEVNVADELGETALHKACRVQNLELLGELLRRGAYVDIPNNAGMRPISVALALGDREAANALIAAGTDLRMLSPNDGSTLLHSTCWAGHEEMTSLLLSTARQHTGGPIPSWMSEL